MELTRYGVFSTSWPNALVSWYSIHVASITESINCKGTSIFRPARPRDTKALKSARTPLYVHVFRYQVFITDLRRPGGHGFSILPSLAFLKGDHLPFVASTRV